MAERAAQKGVTTGCPPRPFLRWAGGKQKLATVLATFVPSQNRYKKYFETFLGGGAVFFSVQPKQAVISDTNEDLMNCYRQVSRHPKQIAASVHQYARRDSHCFFYQIRSSLNSKSSVIERAARFIYLNKTAFNGIYRVNTKGQFNVPYGPSQNGPAIPSPNVLRAASRCLRRARIVSGDFEDVVAEASRNDFVYLDPPYPPRSDTAYFAHYSADRFGWKQQVRVARIFRRLARKGCLVMLSNADQKKVRSLYKGFFIRRLSTTRWLGSNGDRFGVREIVVTNYDPAEWGK